MAMNQDENGEWNWEQPLDLPPVDVNMGADQPADQPTVDQAPQTQAPPPDPNAWGGGNQGDVTYGGSQTLRDQVDTSGYTPPQEYPQPTPQPEPTPGPIVAPTQSPVSSTPASWNWTPSAQARGFDYPPPGFDFTKWNDPNEHDAKYTVGHILAGGGTIQQAAAAVGGTVVGPDSINIPGDGTYDAIFDVGGANRAQWNRTGGSSGQASGGSGGSTGSSTGVGNAAIGQRSIEDYIRSLQRTGGQVAGPGSPGIFPGPVQQVGQDEFSKMIAGGYGQLLGGGGQIRNDLSDAVSNSLMQTILNGGKRPEDTQNQNLRFEKATEFANAARTSQMNNARAALANNNLLSENGIDQGPFAGTMGRIEDRIAVPYAQAIRDLMIQGNESQDARLKDALTTATGMNEQQSNTFLNTLGSASNRQEMLSRVALDTLAQNVSWQKFLMTNGIDAARLQWDIQNGQTTQALALARLYMEQGQSLSQGSN